jgi:hypothetical protein
MSAAKPAITQKDLKNLLEQLSRMQRDKDRVRLVSVAAESFSFTTAQVLELVDAQTFGDARNQTAILTHPRLTDPENFEKVVLASFKFKEDQAEIKESLGL